MPEEVKFFMCCVEPGTVSSPERDIKAVLDESGPDYETFTFERPTAGHQGEVFLVTLRYAGQEYEVVVKFQAGDPGFALEPFLHEYVADRTDIPVPRILVFEEEPELDIDSYFVTERISGDNLAESIGELDETTRERVIEHAGRILGDMHARIGFEGTPFEDLQDDAREYVAESVHVVDTSAVPRLVHDDFRPANMLFDASRSQPITAVLDWQFALAADPEYQIARTDFLFIDPAFQDADTRNRLRDRLYTGYREYREFDPDEGYEQRRAVYHFATLLWRMAGFEAAFADFSELAKGRAEARFRQQFDQLAGALPSEESSEE